MHFMQVSCHIACIHCLVCAGTSVLGLACMLPCHKPRDDLSACEKTLGAVGCKLTMQLLYHVWVLVSVFLSRYNGMPCITYVSYYLSTCVASQVRSTISTRRSVIWSLRTRRLVTSKGLLLKPLYLQRTSMTKGAQDLHCCDKADS